MTLRPTRNLILVAVLLLASCGSDNGSSGSGDSARSEQRTTTTVPADYQDVIDARLEALRQYDLARANPTNPEPPVLRDYFTDVELMNVIEDVIAGTANSFHTVFPEDSPRRITIGSVTFSQEDPNVAWLETCWVDDGEQRYVRTGTPRFGETQGVRTAQRTEEMRKEDDHWKVARSFNNTSHDGATGCAANEDYEQDYSETTASREITQTVSDRRTAAEQAYVSYLTNPSYTGYADTWTGFQHANYFANPPFASDGHRIPDRNYCPPDPTLITTGGPFSGQSERFYLQPDHLNPWRTDPYYQYYDDTTLTSPDQYNSPCYNDYELGQNAWSFNIRNNGQAFDPSTSSSVVVQSVQLQATENPHVAYLTTCRTYHLAPTGQGPFEYLDGTTAAVETMHLVDGTWKVSNRWGYAPTDTCT